MCLGGIKLMHALQYFKIEVKTEYVWISAHPLEVCRCLLRENTKKVFG